MKAMFLQFNWAKGLSENYVLIYWWDSNLSNLSWKVNLDLWNLFIGIVSLGLTYRLRIWLRLPQLSKQSTFQKKSIYMR